MVFEVTASRAARPDGPADSLQDGAALDRAADLVAGGGVVVLSGAGLSTESGIPDYRGPTGALRRSRPMTYQAFTGDADARRRYWARSHLGWHHVARARPNAGHRAVAELEAAGTVVGTVTQNVDGLHTEAGSHAVVELHGNLHRVVCLDCGALSSRAELHRRLRAANPGFAARVTAIHPDGDVDLADVELADFRTVDCTHCDGGTLKPDVVYFGETVPRDRVDRAFAAVDAARVLLVLGSSLAVMSGYRFVLHAARRDTPVVIVNQGVTRGDAKATVTLDAPLGEVLPELARRGTAGAGEVRAPAAR